MHAYICMEYTCMPTGCVLSDKLFHKVSKRKSAPCSQDQQLTQPHIFFLNPENAAQPLGAA